MARRTAKRKRKPILWLFLTLMGAVAVGAGAGVWFLQSPGGTGKATVVIAKGTTALQIGHELERAGVVRNGQVFAGWAFLRGRAQKFKAGRYTLQKSWSASQIADILTRGGEPEDIVVTIPEGFTLKQIAARLKAKKLISDEDAFVEMADQDAPPVRVWFPIPKEGLEGYLYPDTYRFRPGTKPEVILQTMVSQFDTEFASKNRSRVEASGHTLHQLVTIASLIEREADIPSDRATIAGVLENRLKKGMRLQIDATVLYALGKHKNRVLYSDLKVKSPYNTYRNAGLPPGPIASPGIACLEAALNPEKHDYLYYVMSGERGHVFTRTEAEHNQAVAKYRAARKARASRS